MTENARAPVSQPMSRVEEALRSQKSVWRNIVRRIIEERLRDVLPPYPPKRILLFGEGSSLHAAKLASFCLIREMTQRKNLPWVPILSCSSVNMGFEVIPARGDWVFALSHRGTTVATLQALERCSRAGCFPVLVAAQGVDHVPQARLIIPTSPLEKCEPHTVGLSGAICAVTTLLLGSNIARSWESLSSQSNPKLDQLRSEVGEGPSLILGEWEGEWLARETALKLTEMALLRAPVYGAEEFFHGPRVLSQSLSPPDRIWYIAMPKDPRSREISAVNRVQVPFAHSLSWVSSLVHLQWQALAVALNLGRNPDGIHS